MHVVRRLRAHIRNNGVWATVARIYRIARKQERAEGYERCVPKPPPEADDRVSFSVIIPVYGIGLKELRECVESVEAQRYESCQVVLVNDADRAKGVVEYLRKMAREPGFECIERSRTGGISAATNDGLAAALGEFCVFLDCDDILERNALDLLNRALLRNPTLDMLYSDEDTMSPDGRHFYQPFCKPDWSPESFWSSMYTCHLAAVRTSLLRELGGFRSEYDGAQDYDLVLRIAERTGRIGHVPQVLYHWRARRGSSARGSGEKGGASEAGISARRDALKRRGVRARLEKVHGLPQTRVVFEPPPDALVSIIIPGKDKPELLEACLGTLSRFDTGMAREIIFVDNGSNAANAGKYRGLCAAFGARYLFEDIPFNYSRLNNLAVAASKGRFLCFLNDDTEAMRDGWLAEMVGQAAQEGVGAVGAKLLYPDGKLIQHASVVLLRQGPSHLLQFQEDNPRRYFGWSELAWNVSAVTAACLVTSRANFERAGGFDESFAVAYNDVDLCLRLRYLGLRNVVRNDVSVIHHESLSRGNDFQETDARARLASDLALLGARHAIFSGDPYYNPQLDQYRIDFHYDRTRFSAGDFRPGKTLALKPVASVLGRGSSDGTRWHVNLFLAQGGEVHLEGWAFRKGVDSIGLGVGLWCLSGGRWWHVECRRHLRLDIQSGFSLGRDGDFSGIYLSCRIPDAIGADPRSWTLVIGRGRSRIAVALGD